MCVNLDEYKGLSPENDQSYRYFMNTNLFDHVNIDKTRTFVPDGLEADSAKACNDYNAVIRKQGGVFPEHLIKNFIALKRKECLEMSKIPHPAEFDKYFNL